MIYRLALAFCLFTCPALASARVASSPTVDKLGNLWVKLDGRPVKLASKARQAWVFGTGNNHFVIWSGDDGAGGFENEGQSLRTFAVQSKTYLKVMSEYTMVENVAYAQSASGRPALLVALLDGGLGLPRVAVVDPNRGEVLKVESARVKSVAAGQAVVEMLDSRDFEAGNYRNPRVTKTVRYDLDAVLKGKVITNLPARP